MKNKITNLTKAASTAAKTRATSVKTSVANLKAKVTRTKAAPKVTPKVTNAKVTETKVTDIVPKVETKESLINRSINFINTLGIVTTISSLLASIVRIFGAKSQYFFLFSIGMLLFRKSLRTFLLISGLFFLILTIISFITGQDLSFSVLTFFQALLFPFAWVLKQINCNVDVLIAWFKEIMNYIAEKIKDLEATNKNDNDKFENPWKKIFKNDDDEPKKTHYPLKYYLIGLGIVAGITIIYTNPGDVTGVFLSCVDSIKNHTWFSNTTQPTDIPEAEHDDSDDGDDGAGAAQNVGNAIGGLIRRFRPARLLNLFLPSWLTGFGRRREQLNRDAYDADNDTWRPHAPPASLFGPDMPTTLNNSRPGSPSWGRFNQDTDLFEHFPAELLNNHFDNSEDGSDDNSDQHSVHSEHSVHADSHHSGESDRSLSPLLSSHTPEGSPVDGPDGSVAGIPADPNRFGPLDGDRSFGSESTLGSPQDRTPKPASPK